MPLDSGQSSAADTDILSLTTVTTDHSDYEDSLPQSPFPSPPVSVLSDSSSGGGTELVEQHDDEQSTATEPQSYVPPPPGTWLPYTLKWPFLTLLIFSTTALMLTTLALYSYSSTHHGLGRDDGSAIRFFGWRFAPSLLAVLYVQLTAMLLDDVKRTEPFARMARLGGGPGSSTVLQRPGAWWNALIDGFSQRKRSWTLASAALINILGFLVVSPLSPSLLEPASILTAEHTDFSMLQTAPTLQINTGRETYLRILANILQNVSTSAWITDEYTASPVWPSSFGVPPLGPFLSSTPETWHAETLVMNTELDCRSMHLRRTQLTNESSIDTTLNKTEWTSVAWASLSTDDGCDLTIKFNYSDMVAGAVFWSAISDSAEWMTLDYSEACDGKELVFAMTPLAHYVDDTVELNSDFNISAHICTPDYYTAKMDIAVASTGEESKFRFDERKYHEERSPIQIEALDVEAVQEMALSSNWSRYIPYIVSSQSPNIDGLALLLAALYDFDVAKMADDHDLITPAGQVKQRVFGEVLQYSLLQQEGSSQDSVAGIVDRVERRIVVVGGVAITLIVVLLVSLGLLVALCLLTRPRHRPLHLCSDPAKVTTVCSLVARKRSVRQTFLSYAGYPEKALYDIISQSRYHISSRDLHETRCDASLSESVKPKKSKPNATPTNLRLRTLCGLMLTLIVVLVSLLVLYSFAQSSSLHQAFFVYETNVTVLNVKVDSVAPVSIIPTLIAVGIGLWWGSMDSTFRRLQPFLSTANMPTPASRGIALSYQSSYWLAAAFKAALNRHWFLCFITVGTTLSQIFTISMSALFQRSEGVQISTATLDRGLEIRDVPFVYQTSYQMTPHSNPTPINVLTNLYQDLGTNWLYSATLQLTLNASQPAWSRDGWSFVPVETESLSSSTTSPESQALHFQSAVNITVQTPGIRARIKCVEYEGLNNHSSWLTQLDVSNSSEWNQSTIPNGMTTGYELGVDGSAAFFNTSFFVSPSNVQCCANGTGYPPSNLAFGYWSSDDGVDQTPYGHLNISMKWIYGPGVSGVWMVDEEPDYEYGVPQNARLVFTEVPAITAIRCEPIIETANADVTVNGATGAVQSFTILSEPEAYTNAWTDAFLVHEADPDYNGSEVNTTTSFGILFQRALLGAAYINGLSPGDNSLAGITDYEDLSDQCFNYRDPKHGLNLDFMTYTMYISTGQDPTSLTDTSTFSRAANLSFATFFQHFASASVARPGDGSWAFQRINATLPADLGAAVADGDDDGAPKASVNYSMPHSTTARTAQVSVAAPIEVLEMNAVAVWLSAAILAWLVVTTAVVGVWQRRYLRNLERNVECVADVLALVAGSGALLRLVAERGPDGLDGERGVVAKLGWFEDEDGKRRWGFDVIEVQGERDDGAAEPALSSVDRD